MNNPAPLERLSKQLRPLLERPFWLPESSEAPERLELMIYPDPSTTHVLLVWVEKVVAANGNDFFLKLAPAGTPEANWSLQEVNGRPERQVLTVKKLSSRHFHLLVLGWALAPAADLSFRRSLMSRIVEPVLMSEGPELRTLQIKSFGTQGALTDNTDDSSEYVDGDLPVQDGQDTYLDTSLLLGLLVLIPGLPEAERLVSLIDGPSSDTKARQAEGNGPNQLNGSAASAGKRGNTCFIFASCQYPAGLLDHVPASASYRRIEQSMGTSPRPEALLLLGDQIYADATFGILDPAIDQALLTQTYLDLHESLKKYPHLSSLKNASKPRLFSSPDDHEIKDNWEPSAQKGEDHAKTLGLKAFALNGLSRLPGEPHKAIYWGSVEVGGGHEVFMLDTRTTREPRPWGPGTGPNQAHIICAAQRQALESWLNDQLVNDRAGCVTPKFISSQVWLLPRHAGHFSTQDPTVDLSAKRTRLDSWEGYPQSLYWLLGFIAKKKIHGVVVLCGDAHLAGRTQVTLSLNSCCMDVLILHTPALYAPFPFANAQPHHYRGQDSFDFKISEGIVQCEVTSQLHDLGNGFVRVEVTKTDTNGWQVRPVFDSETSLTESMCAPWPCPAQAFTYRLNRRFSPNGLSGP